VRRKGTLFRALLEVADGAVQECDRGACQQLHLAFDFGLDAPDKESFVEGTFSGLYLNVASHLDQTAQAPVIL
jgi:hypothetical protein